MQSKSFWHIPIWTAAHFSSLAEGETAVKYLSSVVGLPDTMADMLDIANERKKTKVKPPHSAEKYKNTPNFKEDISVSYRL